MIKIIEVTQMTFINTIISGVYQSLWIIEKPQCANSIKFSQNTHDVLI